MRAETLQRLFAKYVTHGERVVVGPRVGEDAAVLDMGDRYLVATTDPITFATDEMGRYAVHVNANDLAVRGALPRWFLATLLLPEGQTTEPGVEELFAEIAEACGEIGASLVGGHTEITAGLARAVVVGAMLGEVDKDRLVTTAGARPGDRVLLTKGVPLEGAALIARERGEEAERRGVPRAVVARARQFLRAPGISVVPEARLACGAARVHAMHDPTEGGLATACWELAQAGEVGLRVERERIPVLPEGERLCRAFGLDPLGTIASGALLLAVDAAAAEAVLAACRGGGVACAVIGEVRPAGEGVTLVSGGRAAPMPSFPQDEISRLFTEA
ncbi:MAG: hydrogenase expression/formation protein [Candidatus Rokubacteria bacterium]|nr:hydrogenase expression/formation protein [Candidatus Rokubacteria bacterium]